MRKTVITILAILIFTASCRQKQETSGPPAAVNALADTLVQILDRLRETAHTNQAEEFLGMLDSAESVRLRGLASRNGFHSLRTYVEHLFAYWPDPDTLALGDLIFDDPYARLTLTRDCKAGQYKEETVRYTFVLFKKEEAQWRLAAISSLEKDRYDLYGTELSYLETELPPKLRFPRLF